MSRESISLDKWLRRFIFIAAVCCLASASAAAQRARGDGSLSCNDGWSNEERASHCEVKEKTLAATGGTISVDSRRNGGISIKGWNRNEVLVRYKVQTSAPTQEAADQLASAVRLETANMQIHSETPETRDEQNVAVSYEIFVPQHSSLSLKAYNGGIAVSDVGGEVEFATINGGVALKRLGGRVHGETTNGGLFVELSGNRWDGEGLDVRTVNGGVVLNIPDNYSAHLETSTVHGGFKVGLPIAAEARNNKELSVNLGSGGATVRAVTTNGGVLIKSAGAGSL